MSGHVYLFKLFPQLFARGSATNNDEYGPLCSSKLGWNVVHLRMSIRRTLLGFLLKQAQKAVLEKLHLPT